ncbi:MAG: hypothetical protein RL662_2496 [Bacteroidota bacterium]|jgi:carbonic anhydrase
MLDDDTYKDVFEANKRWVAEKNATDPDFFKQLASEQNPDFLYIGCSDSRVHANEIMGLKPGQVFVHRNIANMVINTDLNVLSVINYGVVNLNVKYIIVCGHYNCGGIKAAIDFKDTGLISPWLRSIRDVYRLHADELNAITDETLRFRRFVELNIYEQCINVIKIREVRESFKRTGYPKVAGWVYDIDCGALIDMEIDLKKEFERIHDLFRTT